MRFYALTDNTGNYFNGGANNFPYGPPPKLEDNEMDYGEPEGLRPSEYPTPHPPPPPPPFTKKNSSCNTQGRRGVSNFILHALFYLTFSKIPDSILKYIFQKYFIKAAGF